MRCLREKAKNLFIILLLSTLLIPLFPVSSHASDVLITVKLRNYLGNQTSVSVQVTGEHFIKEDNRKLEEEILYTVKLENNSLKLYKGTNLVKDYGSSFTIEPVVYSKNSYITINGRDYLGLMTFNIEGRYIRPSNILAIDDYLKGVVPAEMPASWSLEALKAQAVAARTYVTAYLNSSNIDDTQKYQVFNGYIWKNTKVYQNSTRAVDETSGQIITYNGKSIRSNATFYSANGGRKLSNTNVWGSSLVPYLKGGEDPYDLRNEGNSYRNWEYSLPKIQIDLNGLDLYSPEIWWDQVSEISDSGMINRIKNWMYTKTTFNPDYEMKITDIVKMEFSNNFSDNELLEGKITIKYILKNNKENTFRKDPQGRIKKFQYTIEDGSNSIRTLIGSSIMRSPYVKEVIDQKDRIVVKGGGFGHGVGMSQHGAHQMAKEGHKYRDILQFYYPGTEITEDSSLILMPAIRPTVSFDKKSPQPVNTEIKLTASSKSGSTVLYKFNLFDGKDWKVVQDYSPSNTYIWRPTKTGTYKFSIHVKDKYSNKDYDNYYAVEFTIVDDFSKVMVEKVVPDKSSPQSVRTPIKLTTYVHGGQNGLLYKYNLYNGKEWLVVRDYSEEPDFTWIPEKPGNYRFSVHVKDKKSTKPYDAYGVLDYTITPEPVTVKSLSATPNSPQQVGTDILLRATATGGTDLLYKFHIFDGNTWSVLRDYGRNNKHTWKPTKPGRYKLVVHVKDRTSKKGYDDYTYTYFDITGPKEEPVVAKSLSGTPSSPQKPGTDILLRATATGGKELLYKFYVYDGKSWTVLKDYGRNNKYTWRPTKTGNYKLVVHVKDRSSKKDYDDYAVLYYDIQTTDPVEVKSLSASPSGPQKPGTDILLRTTATGGTELLYKFHIFDGNTWTVLREYGRNNKYTWRPKQPGEYKIVVHVKDRSSKKAYDDYFYIWVTIEK